MYRRGIEEGEKKHFRRGKEKNYFSGQQRYPCPVIYNRYLAPKLTRPCTIIIAAF
jgi:hypothetical protein